MKRFTQIIAILAINDPQLWNLMGQAREMNGNIELAKEATLIIAENYV